MLGHYFASKAWVLGVECLVLKRRELEELLGIERFKGSRREWMAEDFRPWFPYQHTYFLAGSADTFYSIYLSRVEIESHLPDGTMMDEERILSMESEAPSTALLFPNGMEDVPSLKEIVAELAILGAGMDAPVSKRIKTSAVKKIVRKTVAKKAVKKVAR
jgi:hypothetical protein